MQIAIIRDPPTSSFRKMRSIYAESRVVRKVQWIPCQARNDEVGVAQIAIIRDPPTSSFRKMRSIYAESRVVRKVQWIPCQAWNDEVGWCKL